MLEPKDKKKRRRKRMVTSNDVGEELVRRSWKLSVNMHYLLTSLKTFGSSGLWLPFS